MTLVEEATHLPLDVRDVAAVRRRDADIFCFDPSTHDHISSVAAEAALE